MEGVRTGSGQILISFDPASALAKKKCKKKKRSAVSAKKKCKKRKK